ncbi:MAG: UDP-glucose--hexose-1-phosphate uridylyltransferase [Chloroflexi bacterium]|jgi:UDPglucose--hexose-1-phosphate uridylyltransferase|nr:UDP-glucose--hexose-1-phosphate uridylyltransferase [Chloroflexota bacterium]
MTSSDGPARDAHGRDPRAGSRDTLKVDGLLTRPHRRHDPLLDEWVLVSPGRTRRPWLGHRDPQVPATAPAFDPGCYLCPGNARVGGEVNPAYEDTFVFTNDFAALLPDTEPGRLEDRLLRAEAQRGTCRVVCFSPRHDLTMARMPAADVRRLVDLWAVQTEELGARYAWVQVFENRGEAMGASNPHPHGQIWAGEAIPREAAREDASQRQWAASTGRRLLLDYAAQESGGPRVVGETADWLVVVPFWATWPFETLVVARRPRERLAQLEPSERDGLATVLVELQSRYDNLFTRPFPYSWGWHQAPFTPGAHDHWQLHAHFYPPLLRASQRKFMVGYELLAETQRDLLAETAAEQLRAVPPVHYLDAVEVSGA